MTFDLAQLNLATPFSGSDTITTTDGSGLSISNVGSSILDVLQCSFKLKQVLHVPKLSQHFLSVHRLCKDNDRADLSIMHLAFAFRTRLKGGFFSKAYVEMVCILLLSLFHNLDYHNLFPFPRINYAILVTK